MESFLPCKPLKQIYLSSRVSDKPFITLMNSVYTKEGYQNSVKYPGVDTELEPALLQVAAGGPITEELSSLLRNRRTRTQRQLALVGHVTASVQQYIPF